MANHWGNRAALFPLTWGTIPERPRRVVQKACNGAHEHEGGEQRCGVVEAAADVGGGQADELELVQRPLDKAAEQRQNLPPAHFQVRTARGRSQHSCRLRVAACRTIH